MKKIITLLSVFILLISSCSGDDETQTSSETPATNDGVFLKRKVEKNENDEILNTYDYTYNGNKLTKIVQKGGSYIEYIYNNDLISEIKFYYPDNSLFHTESFFYNSFNQLTDYIFKSVISDSGYKRIYTYSTNGTVIVHSFHGDLISQTQPANEYEKMYVQNSALVKHEFYNVSNNILTRTSTFAYDDKKNPFKNVLGFDKIHLIGSDPTEWNINNLTHENNDGEVSTFQYIYNGFNYPITGTQTNNDSASISRKYEYTYY